MSRRARTTEEIPHLGVIVSRKVVLNHRYLYAHGLPHSRSIANIHIGTKQSRRLERDMDQQFNFDRGLTTKAPKTRHRLGVVGG